MTEITKKGIVSVGNVRDPEIRRVLSSIVEALQMIQGAQGKLRDRAVRVSDLVDLGILAISDQDNLYDPSKPVVDEFLEHLLAPSGFTGIFACIETTTGHTIHILVENGEVIGYTGSFDVVVTSTGATDTVVVASGLCSPSGTYDVTDPHTSTTMTMTIVDGRISQII